MAKPTTAKSGKLRVEIGDGASPEAFAAPCGFTSKAFNRGKTLNTTPVPDCDDPDAPAWEESDVATLNWSVTGQGVLAAESLPLWDEFYASTDPKNVQIEIELPAPTGTITYSGQAHLESFEIAAELGQRITANITIRGDGELIRAPAIT